MSRKADFSSSEWARLREAASTVGLGMIAVSKSGVIGKLRELAALSACLSSRRAPSQFRGNELVMAILGDVPFESAGLLTRAFRRGSDNDVSRLLAALAVARRTMLPQCEDVAALLARSPRAEAEGVKRWLLWVARTVAEASGDKWLGMGRKVSADEVSMLNQIARALDIPLVAAAPTPDELEAMLGLKLPGAGGASGVGEDFGSRQGSGE